MAKVAFLDPLRGKHLAWLVAIAAACTIYLAPPGASSGTDYVMLHSLNRQYWAEALLEGRLPLWNPHVGLGRPFAADIETTSFYPATFLYLLGPRFGLAACTFLHLGLAALGMSAFARRLSIPRGIGDVMGLVFVISAPLGARLFKGQVGFVQALSFLPLAFLGAMQLREAPRIRPVALVALTLGLQLLAGHPQVSWLTWLGMALFLLGYRLHTISRATLRLAGRDLALLCLAITWAAGVAAVMLVPFGELVLEGNRSAPSLAFATSFALRAQDLASLIFLPEPHVVERVFGWEANLYAGALVALAGLSGLLTVRNQAASGLRLVLGVSLVLALGDRTPVFRWALELLPGLSSFRIPSRAAVLTTFALLGLAGLFMSERGTSAIRRAIPLVLWVGLALTSVLAWKAFFREEGAGLTWLAVHLCASLLAAALVYAWVARGEAEASRTGLAVLVFLVLDLGAAAWIWRASFTPYVAPPGEHLLAEVIRRPEFARPGGELPRAFLPPGVARFNSGMALGFSSPMGYVALSLDRVWVYLHEGVGLPLPLNNTFPADELWARAFPYDSMNLVLGYEKSTEGLVGRPPADPRVYAPSCVVAVDHWREAVRRMSEGHDFHRCALVERSRAELRAGLELSGGTARITSFQPERVGIRTESDGEMLVVLAEAWYPGWRAELDGRGDLPCFPVNAWMRGVLVPPGRHDVVLAYRSRFLAPGALLSLLSLLAVAGAFRPTARKTRSGGAEERGTAPQ